MIQKLDSTYIGKINNQSDMDEFVRSLELRSDVVIIKPNWVEAAPGTHTEAKVLDLLLTSLKAKKIYILESYTFWRHQLFFEKNEDVFSSKEADFETGKIHWDFYKKADDWFLKHEGNDQVLVKHNATYINVTDELWAGNVSPVPLVPQKIYNLRGCDFISVAKLKGDADYGASLSIKNFFGLYPDPSRFKKFHRENENKLLQGIIDINKTYRDLFNCTYVVEGVYSASHFDWSHPENSTTFPNTGVIIGGKDGLQVDDTALKVVGRKLSGTLTNLLIEYQKQIGGTFQPQDVHKDYQINFPKL